MATIIRSAAEEKIRAISSWTGGDGSDDGAFEAIRDDDSGASFLCADHDRGGSAVLIEGTVEQVKQAVANLAKKFYDTWDACCENGWYIYSTPGGTEVEVNKEARGQALAFRNDFRYFKFGGPAPKPFSAPTSPVQATTATYQIGRSGAEVLAAKSIDDMGGESLLKLHARFSEAWHKKLDSLPSSAPVALQITKALIAFQRATLRPGTADVKGPEAVRQFFRAVVKSGFLPESPVAVGLMRKYNLHVDENTGDVRELRDLPQNQETRMTTSARKIAATLNRAGLRAQAQRLVRAAGDGAGDQLPLPEIGIRDDKVEEAVKAIDTEVQQQMEHETEGAGGDGYEILIKESIQRMSLADIVNTAKEDRHADPAKLQRFVGAIEEAQAAGLDEQTIKDELIWQCSCVAGSIHGPMNKPYAGAAYEKQPVLDAYPVQEIEVQLSDETTALLAALTEDERQQVGRKVDGYWDADKPDNNLAYIGTDAVWFCCVTGLDSFVEGLAQKIDDAAGNG